MDEIKVNEIEDMISELEYLSQYAKILVSPEEFFVHMQGHRTELSLALSAFRIAELSKSIIKLLKKQISLKCFDEIDFGKTCRICRSPNKEGRYCTICGQKFEW
jgi:hypothetical protein